MVTSKAMRTLTAEEILRETVEDLLQRIKEKFFGYKKMKCVYHDEYHIGFPDTFKGIEIQRKGLFLGIKNGDRLPEISLWIKNDIWHFKVLRISIRDYYPGEMSFDKRVVYYKKTIILKIEHPLIPGHLATSLIEEIIMPEFNKTKIPSRIKKMSLRPLEIQEIAHVFIGESRENA